MERNKLILVALLTLIPLSYQISTSELQRVKDDVHNLIRSEGSQKHPLMAGCVRLIFHDCVGGGCDGCVNMYDDNNRGLQRYIDQLNTINRRGISKADLWTLCAMEAVTMGARFTPGPSSKPRPSWTYTVGRTDTPEPCPKKVLPDGNLNPVKYLLDNFPYMTVEDAVALMGAHTLGMAHKYESGYEHPWTNFVNWADNEYYKALLNETKYWKQVAKVKPTDYSTIHQWQPEGTQSQLMLHVDIHLLLTLDIPEGSTKSECGFAGAYAKVCDDSPQKYIVEKYAYNNALWMEDFTRAMIKMVTYNQPYMQTFYLSSSF